MHIGLIGLGKMGGNMRTRMRNAGLTVVGYDQLGDLSLMCGLLFAFGFNIESGDVFTGSEVHAPTTTDRQETSPATITGDPMRMSP